MKQLHTIMKKKINKLIVILDNQLENAQTVKNVLLNLL